MNRVITQSKRHQSKRYQSKRHQTKRDRRPLIARFALALALMSGVMLTLSCGDAVEDQLNLNDGYQMFGIRVDPPIARPDDVLTITAYDHHPNLRDLAYNWSVCLYSHGASNHYECINQDALLPLKNEVTPRVRLDLSALGIDLRARLSLAQELNVYGERRDLEEGLDILIILNSGDPSEQLVRTVKRVRVIDAMGEEPLGVNPEIKGWTITESGVANLRPPCVMQPPGSESALTFDEMGAVTRGRERSSVIEEVSGLPVDRGPEDEDLPLCLLHAEAKLDVELDVEGSRLGDWDTATGYTYRWYVTGLHTPLTPTTLGGPGYGQYQLNTLQRAELLFTVRDPAGGFTMGRQRLNLLSGISTQ